MARRWGGGALVAAALVVGPGQSSAGEAPATSASTSPNLLLITVDTLRPDALGWIGGGAHTPTIDGLARNGVAFPRAVAPVPLTLPSHTSILTGLLPRHHGVHDNGQVVDSDLETLAEVLRARGYSTGAVVSGYPLRRVFGLDQGFDHYEDTLPLGSEGWLERRAKATSEEAARWLLGVGGPWFLWVHYYDPHDPYEPDRAFWLPGPRGAYDGEVAQVDAGIATLLAAAHEASAGRPVVTVLTADHAESLGEHGEQTHGYFVYDTTMVVPLIFHAPGRWLPRVVESSPRLIDIAPTVLELLSLPVPPGLDGTSLMAVLGGGELEPRPAYLESRQPWITYGWAPLTALRHQSWKLIVAPRPELYDLQIDPGENSNLFDQRRDRARELRDRLRELEAKPPAAAATVDDTETLEALRALGYLGGQRRGEEPPPRGLPDPKDRLRERDELIAGEVALRQGRFDEALGRFQRVLERDPANRFALLRSGITLLKRGDAVRAIPLLRRAVELDPEQAEVRYALADALTRTAAYEQAAQEWMETIRLQPRRAAAWSNLGTVQGALRRVDLAVEAFSRAIELEPDNARLRENLAFAEYGRGRKSEAIRHLLDAADSSTTGEFRYSATLGLWLQAVGRGEESRRWLERARAGERDFAAARLALAKVRVRAGERELAAKLVGEALAEAPGLRPAVEADPELAPLL